MSQKTPHIGHLERSVDDNRLRRALAARIDRTFKQAGVTSTQAAKWLGVSEDDVQHWRRGITVPPLNVCTRLAAAFNLDIHWLCTGQAHLA
jgi:DNA-binding XRE family transcriptional regulator